MPEYWLASLDQVVSATHYFTQKTLFHCLIGINDAAELWLKGVYDSYDSTVFLMI